MNGIDDAASNPARAAGAWMLSIQESSRLDQNSQKIRVYALARELNIDTKELMDLARQHGIDVKNQLSNLEPDQRDALEQMVRKGGGVALAAPPKPAEPPRPSQVMGKVRTLAPARPVHRAPGEPPHAAPLPTPTEPAQP